MSFQEHTGTARQQQGCIWKPKDQIIVASLVPSNFTARG
jgi:hypothetical protein